VGNPHVCSRYPISTFDWRGLGAEIERHGRFPIAPMFIRAGWTRMTIEVRASYDAAPANHELRHRFHRAAAAGIRLGLVSSPVNRPARRQAAGASIGMVNLSGRPAQIWRRRIHPLMIEETLVQQIREDRIRNHKARVGDRGLGYVGLAAGGGVRQGCIEVIGIDLSAIQGGKVNAGESYIADIPAGFSSPWSRSG